MVLPEEVSGDMKVTDNPQKLCKIAERNASRPPQASGGTPSRFLLASPLGDGVTFGLRRSF